MKKIFVVDWLLIPFSILSAFSGFKLHIAGHGNIHEIWHIVSVISIMHIIKRLPILKKSIK